MTLPDCTLAVLRRRRTLPDVRRTAALDALVVLTAPNDVALLRRLPESARWLGAACARQAHSAQRGAAPRWPTARQTFAQLAYVKAGASSFERLTLAGKLLRELAARKPGRIGFAGRWQREPMRRCGMKRC
jgi:hypothetical protein